MEWWQRQETKSCDPVHWRHGLLSSDDATSRRQSLVHSSIDAALGRRSKPHLTHKLPSEILGVETDGSVSSLPCAPQISEILS